MKTTKIIFGSLLLALVSYASMVGIFHLASSVILPSGDAPVDWRE
jgi:hypothetical protein